MVFQSKNQRESQRQVGSGEDFTYAFPLEIRHAAHADDVRITLYLFKASSGPSTGDIAKVFMNSPKRGGRWSVFLRRASSAFPTMIRPTDFRSTRL
jgi:hypothetical protein